MGRGASSVRQFTLNLGFPALPLAKEGEAVTWIGLAHSLLLFLRTFVKL